MKEVNVYLHTTVRCPRKGCGAYTYVLEMKMGNANKTLTHTEAIIGMTAHQAELTMLVAALKRIFQKCRLTIYTDSKYLAAGAEKWLKGWKLHGWNNAKGDPVANMEQWQELSCLLEAHTYHFVVGGRHDYYEWMRSESERAGNSVYSRGDRQI